MKVAICMFNLTQCIVTFDGYLSICVMGQKGHYKVPVLSLIPRLMQLRSASEGLMSMAD